MTCIICFSVYYSRVQNDICVYIEYGTIQHSICSPEKQEFDISNFTVTIDNTIQVSCNIETCDNNGKNCLIGAVQEYKINITECFSNSNKLSIRPVETSLIAAVVDFIVSFDDFFAIWIG